jgi:hypothetical protein
MPIFVPRPAAAPVFAFVGRLRHDLLSGGCFHGALDARSDIWCDLVRCLGGCRLCKCSGHSPRCSRGRERRRSGGRSGRCSRGRCRGSGYRHGQWNSGSSTDSCSRCEHVHRFWRLIYRNGKSYGKEARCWSSTMLTASTQYRRHRCCRCSWGRSLARGAGF